MKYLLLLLISLGVHAQDMSLIKEAEKLEGGLPYLYREYLKSKNDPRANEANMALIYNKEINQEAYDKMKEISEAMKKEREDRKANKERVKKSLIKKLGQLGITQEELAELGL